MGFISRYEIISGQKINYSKGKFLLYKNVYRSKKHIIEATTKFREGEHPPTYLGAPSLYVKIPIFAYDIIISKICKKVANWKDRLVSVGRNLSCYL